MRRVAYASAERATTVGYSSLWSVLESIAESNSELVVLGLDEIVEVTIESIDQTRGESRHPARPLVVLAEQYPRRVWALLEKYVPDDESTTLLERTSQSRIEEKIQAILDAAGPVAPLSGNSQADANE